MPATGASCPTPCCCRGGALERRHVAKGVVLPRLAAPGVLACVLHPPRVPLRLPWPRGACAPLRLISLGHVAHVCLCTSLDHVAHVCLCASSPFSTWRMCASAPHLSYLPPPQIADAWYSILQLHDDRPALSAACLHTIHLYVGWIDISLIATPRFMQRFFAFMRTEQLHEGACLCLAEVVSKRMDAAAKVGRHHRTIRSCRAWEYRCCCLSSAACTMC